MNRFNQFFSSLRNLTFARLYLSQTINLVGDALTWVGLAFLAFELAGQDAGGILSIALTLRVTAFVLLSPLAGALADRRNRKSIMLFTHLGRMGLVCLLPFVTQTWQIYSIILLLSGFSAFFTPTYTATIPLVTGKEDYPQAIALSSATHQLLGILGPGLVGGVAVLVHLNFKGESMGRTLPGVISGCCWPTPWQAGWGIPLQLQTFSGVAVLEDYCWRSRMAYSDLD
jgi:MFS transporter, NRE family, putaive nickel resistance protein